MGMRTIRLTIYGLMIVSLLISCVHGGKSLTKRRYGKYYFYVYLSIISMALGRIFIFVYSLASGDTDGFTLGSLGIISAYLFISAANKELQDRIALQITSQKERIAKAGSFLIIGLLGCVCLFGQLTFVNMLPSLLLMITAGYGFYSALRIVLAGKKGNDVYPYLVSFNHLVCIVLINSFFSEATWLIGNQSLVTMINLVIGIINIICFMLMLPFLERGLNQWKM